MACSTVFGENVQFNGAHFVKHQQYTIKERLMVHYNGNFSWMAIV